MILFEAILLGNVVLLLLLGKLADNLSWRRAATYASLWGLLLWWLIGITYIDDEYQHIVQTQQEYPAKKALLQQNITEANQELAKWTYYQEQFDQITLTDGAQLEADRYVSLWQTKRSQAKIEIEKLTEQKEAAIKSQQEIENSIFSVFIDKEDKSD